MKYNCLKYEITMLYLLFHLILISFYENILNVIINWYIIKILRKGKYLFQSKFRFIVRQTFFL